MKEHNWSCLEGKGYYYCVINHSSAYDLLSRHAVAVMLSGLNKSYSWYARTDKMHSDVDNS